MGGWGGLGSSFPSLYYYSKCKLETCPLYQNMSNMDTFWFKLPNNSFIIEVEKTILYYIFYHTLLTPSKVRLKMK